MTSVFQEDVNCPCDSHAGKLLLDNVYPLSVEEIYELLFTDSPWFKKFNDTLKNTGYIEKSTYQGLDDHYSALEDTLRDECERKAMRPEARQDHVDRYDEESMSSVEDPITEAPRIRSPPARSRVTKRDTSASLPTITPTLTTTSTDYGFYIKIIICLLAGLLFLNTLLLFHVNKIETQATISEDVVQVLQRLADYGKPNEQTVALENLLEKVNQLTTDLQKLKQQISSKQEL
ncbi:hypothetical protein NECAME_11495 [Necator americanus]|uniref:VASt domain-containing protein n=1 Tax=Necator americanus TaxID=51031 RepID=W2T406_NECAM|nr:hypothetical protein NECAME_11495 [Necator americanus]ETN76643.1 hypothetical protein NECAME_11495 [Necator americanus]